jgi:hypothetical protein
MKIQDIKIKFKAFILQNEYFERLNTIFNYKYKLKKKFKRLSKSITSLNIVSSNGKKILLPLIETSHYKFLQLIILAKALEIRGNTVKIIICDSSLNACEIRSSRNSKLSNPCWKCNFFKNEILKKLNLDYISIDRLVPSKTKILLKEKAKNYSCNLNLNIIHREIMLDGCVNDSMIRYFYGDYNNSSEYNNIKEKYIYTALINTECAHIIFNTFNPEVILGYMISYAEWEPYYLYFKKKKIRFTHISSSQYNFNVQLFNWFDLVEDGSRYEKYVKSINRNILNSIEENELDLFLNSRNTGKSIIFEKLNFFENNSNFRKYIIKLKSNKKKYFIFPNIFWDVGMSNTTTIYPSIIEWVLDTINFLSNNKEIEIFVKLHPGEKFDSSQSSKSIADFILEKFTKLPENLTIIYPEDKILTYNLFQYIDLGIVYNGTIGLELLNKNIQIVSAGKAVYNILNDCFVPKTKIEYYNYLITFKESVIFNKNQIRFFSHFYFIRTGIPWKLTNQSYYADINDGYNIKIIDELQIGNDKFLDHLCNCIVDENISPENY